MTFSRVTGSVGVLLRQKKRVESCGSYESASHTTPHTHTHTHTKSVLCLIAYWCNTGHVYEAVVLPRNPPTTLPLPLRCVSVCPQQSPSPARFHYRDGCESVQISPPVVPEQRSGGRQPPRTCCLFTATSSAHKTGKSQDVCVCAHRGVGEEGCRTGRAGWTGEKKRQWRRLLRLRK